MAKITIDPISGSYASVTALNERFQQLEDVLNDDILWRDGFIGEPNLMTVDLDMNGYNLLNVQDFSSEDLYMGAYATPPSEYSPGVPLSTEHTGVLYFNTTDNSMYVWTGTAWSSLSSAATDASAIAIADAGGYYSASNVEDALQDIATSGAAGKGANIIGIEDPTSDYASTDVEGALAEIGPTATQTLENKTMTAPVLNNPVITGSLTVNGFPVKGFNMLVDPVVLHTDTADTGGSWVTFDAGAVHADLITDEATAVIIRVHCSCVGVASTTCNGIYWIKHVDSALTFRATYYYACKASTSSATTMVTQADDMVELIVPLKDFRYYSYSFQESGTTNARGDVVLVGYLI